MQETVLSILALIIAVVVHEYAHGLVANWCGDPTAKDAGRLTLNPIPHIDPVGTLLVPIILAVSQAGFMFGWAKPVPVNPYNLRNFKRDDIFVSLAGPASNFVLTLIATFIIILVILMGSFIASDVVNVIFVFCRYAILWNLVLGFFNLIPIPPLDGSHVLAHFLPDDLADRYRSVGQYGFFIIALLLFIGAIDFLLAPINLVYQILAGFISLVTG